VTADTEDHQVQLVNSLFRSAHELFGKKQCADETVDAYVNRLSTLSKKVDVDDKSLLYALVSGLRAAMASYVLGRNPQTFSKAIYAARLAEFSTSVVSSPKFQALPHKEEILAVGLIL